MSDAMASDRQAVMAAVADAHRREWAYVLAATVRATRDLDLAEECVQDAYARALTAWEVSGVPAKPAQWLTTVARRRAIDTFRRNDALRRRLPLLVDDDVDPPLAVLREDMSDVADGADGADVVDDRLRLVFTCCHPALAPEAQVALTLRLVCGLTTAEVASGFLVRLPTMAARITRAKAKIATARIPYRVPPTRELPSRTAAVLEVVHLVFTTGHTAPVGADLVRVDLVTRALDLARMLRALLPDDAEVDALLALLLLTDARRATRTSADGRLQLLADQDRSRWDRVAIDEGIALLRSALRRRPPGRFALMAAIAAVHAEAPQWERTDWTEIVGLYDLLVQVWPSPVVALNRAVAVGFARGPHEGLVALDALGDDPSLAGYSYLASSRAHLLGQLGRTDDARLAYTEALVLTENDVERAFLAERLRALA